VRSSRAATTIFITNKDLKFSKTKIPPNKFLQNLQFTFELIKKIFCQETVISILPKRFFSGLKILVVCKLFLEFHKFNFKESSNSKKIISFLTKLSAFQNCLIIFLLILSFGFFSYKSSFSVKKF
jgi:hypothetical protein